MTPPMTPREKVVFKQPCEHCQRMTTVDLTALASGSGDHAELARLAEAATRGPWVCKEGSTSYPECDDKDFWSVVLSPAGKEIVTLHERYASKSDDRGDYDFDAAFIAAANPATVLALLAENAALRSRENELIAGHAAAVTALERKLAEAKRLNDRAADLMRQCTDPERFVGASTFNVYANMRAWLSDLSKEAERG